MTWKLVVGAAAVIALVVSGSLYYVAGTPRYSLYVIRKAVQQGDRVTFYQHFDLKQVVSHALDRTVGGIPAGPRIVSKHATESLVPAAGKIVEERLDESLSDPSSVPALAMTIDSIVYRNDGAVVTLKNPADGSTTVLTMQQMANRHWKIVDVDLSKVNVSLTLTDIRNRAAQETPNFPTVEGQPLVGPGQFGQP